MLRSRDLPVNLRGGRGRRCACRRKHCNMLTVNGFRTLLGDFCMNKAQALVRAFHDYYLGDNAAAPTLRDDDLLALRVRLLEEEAGEFAEAVRNRDLVEITDALADMLYVILGTACVSGIDMDPVFEEVHRSNMTKLPPSGGRGKPRKGPNYSPPDIRGVLVRQGWRESRGTDDARNQDG